MVIKVGVILTRIGFKVRRPKIPEIKNRLFLVNPVLVILHVHIVLKRYEQESWAVSSSPGTCLKIYMLLRVVSSASSSLKPEINKRIIGAAHSHHNRVGEQQYKSQAFRQLL